MHVISCFIEMVLSHNMLSTTYDCIVHYENVFIKRSIPSYVHVFRHGFHSIMKWPTARSARRLKNVSWILTITSQYL